MKGQDDKVLEIKAALALFGELNVEIKEISIFHSTTIILVLKEERSGKSAVLECNYCQSFWGDTSVWYDSRLNVSYENERLENQRRQIDNHIFTLKDLATGFYVKCKYLNLLNEYKFKPSGGAIVSSKSKLIESITEKLSSWNKGRVRIVNSNKKRLQVIIDTNTNESQMDFVKENPDKFYSFNTTKFLVVYCYSPTSLCLKFDPWEISKSLIFENNVLYDPESDFEIKCVSVDFEESN